MQNIFYRPLIAADHADYKKLRLDCLKEYPNNFGSTYEEELRSATLKLDNAIQFANDHNFAFGAFTSTHELIGICGFITEPRLKAQHRGEIVQMFVETMYGGQGIGKKLLQLTIEKAFSNKKTELITLSAVYANEKAIALYKQLGFVAYGKLEKYFKDGDQYLTQLFLSLEKDRSGNSTISASS